MPLKPKPGPKTIEYLTPNEVARFFLVVKAPREVAIFPVAYHRGRLASEIGMLKLSDLRIDDGRLQVTRLKGSNSFDYKLTKIERKALRAWLRVRGDRPGPLFLSRKHAGISRQQLHTLMRHYCDLAVIPEEKAHMHVWKHSCGTHLAEDGRDFLDIQDHSGHRNPQSTMVYIELTNKRREAFGATLRDWN